MDKKGAMDGNKNWDGDRDGDGDRNKDGNANINGMNGWGYSYSRKNRDSGQDKYLDGPCDRDNEWDKENSEMESDNVNNDMMTTG